MINKMIYKIRGKREYLDFTDDSWKSNTYVGYRIVTRAYRKSIVALFLVLCGISLIIPDLGLSAILGLKVLGRYG